MKKFNVSNIELKWKRVMIETKLKSNKKTLRFKHRLENKNESCLKQIWNKIKKWKFFFLKIGKNLMFQTSSWNENE